MLQCEHSWLRHRGHFWGPYCSATATNAHCKKERCVINTLITCCIWSGQANHGFWSIAGQPGRPGTANSVLLAPPISPRAHHASACKQLACGSGLGDLIAGKQSGSTPVHPHTMCTVGCLAAQFCDADIQQHSRVCHKTRH
jgi:hypothetical protein